MVPFSLDTERLILVPAQRAHLRAALDGRHMLAGLIGFEVDPEWTMFGEGPWVYALSRMDADPEEAGWWTWFPVLRSEARIIGTCGYKGRPDDSGRVEIGYEVAPAYRGKGLATEIARGLVARLAGMTPVRRVVAHTLAEENASGSVLRKTGFQRTGSFVDPEDGPVWSWGLDL